MREWKMTKDLKSSQAVDRQLSFGEARNKEQLSQAWLVGLHTAHWHARKARLEMSAHL